MTYTELKRYLELSEQIKGLLAEQETIKDKIKAEYSDHPSEIGGISVKVDVRTRTNTDMEGLTAEVGVETVAKYQSATTYPVVTVKALSKAIKSKAAKEA